MALDVVRSLVGQAPVGYEWVEYIAGVCIAIYVLKQVMFLISIPMRLNNKKGGLEL